MARSNPWFEATARDPHLGDVSFTNYKGETETHPYYWADAARKADLGMRGFDDITAQLRELTDRFSKDTTTQANAGWANLGQLTGNDFVTVGRNGQLVTPKTKGGERSKETGYRAPAEARDDDSWIGRFQQRMALSS